MNGPPTMPGDPVPRADLDDVHVYHKMGILPPILTILVTHSILFGMKLRQIYYSMNFVFDLVVGGWQLRNSGDLTH